MVNLAGSNQISHIVDCVLVLESDSDSPLKLLRATKNRFGSTDEVGVFQHAENGLEEVPDPSEILLESRQGEHTGACCTFVSEGIRHMPAEIQALVTKSALTNPRRQFNGVNFQRGQIVCAILDKFCSARLFEDDVFVSTVSGIKATDPQSDLAMAAAILSSQRDTPISPERAFIGELGLTGQVRGNFMVDGKIREAIRLGFTTVVVPDSSVKKIPANLRSKCKIIGIQSVRELADILR